jgi:serine/threonine protein kinase
LAIVECFLSGPTIGYPCRSSMAVADVFGIVGTTQAGNFRVERAVAEGGFGVVYRAQHGGFRAPVALKCLKVPEEMTQLQRNVFLEKFREEAELLFRLSAAIPEVVRPLHVDVLQQQDGRFVPFLAMEWLEGEALDAIILRRREEGLPPLGLPKLVKLLKPAALALARSHHFQGPRGVESIIHRDLKPENIFIAQIGGVETVKILDFGIAKASRVASRAAGRLVESPTSLGLGPQEDPGAFSPGYGAPEQWAPKRFGEAGPWTDVWGISLTMVEVLVGGPAIDGDSITMRKIALDEKRRPTPRSLGTAIPPEVDRIFEKALAVEPKDRYQDLASFWSALESAMGLPLSFTPRRGEAAPAASGSGGGARLGRIELQRKLVPVAKASAPAFDPDAAPNSAAFDFAMDDEPAPADDLEELSDAGTEALLEESLEASLDAENEADPVGEEASLEFDLPPGALDARPVIAAPAPAPVIAAPAPIVAPPAPPVAAPIAREVPAAPIVRPAPAAPAEIDLEADLAAPSRPVPPPSRPMAPSVREFDLPEMSFEPAIAPRRSDPGARRADLAPVNLNRSAPLGRVDAPESMSLGDRLRAPLGILALAITISALEIAYTRFTGTPLMLGPLRPFWIAAPLAIVGVGFTLWRFIGGENDG